MRKGAYAGNITAAVATIRPVVALFRSRGGRLAAQMSMSDVAHELLETALRFAGLPVGFSPLSVSAEGRWLLFACCVDPHAWAGPIRRRIAPTICKAACSVERSWVTPVLLTNLMSVRSAFMSCRWLYYTYFDRRVRGSNSLEVVSVYRETLALYILKKVDYRSTYQAAAAAKALGFILSRYYACGWLAGLAYVCCMYRWKKEDEAVEECMEDRDVCRKWLLKGCKSQKSLGSEVLLY